MAIYRDERNAAFRRECEREIRRMAAEGGRVNLKKVTARVVEMEAPGYFVSYISARRMLGGLMNGKGDYWSGRRQTASRSRREAMAKEIAEKCRRLMEGEGLSAGHALARVLTGERVSSFFMTPSSALRVYYEALKPGLRRSERRRKRKLL